MQDEPSAKTLIEAVHGFMERVAMPGLVGHAAFHARVAANALAIVARELELGPAAEREERARLARLTGLSADAPLVDLNRALCKMIREERIALADKALIDHLRRATLVKVEIDQPNYSGLKTAKAAWGDRLG